MYNKQPKKKKKRVKKKKKEPEIVMASVDVDTIRKKKRKIRKGLAALDTSESSCATSISSLGSMSLDDISMHREAQELNIEYARISRTIQKRVLNYKENNGLEAKFNDDGVVVKYKDLRCLKKTALLLNDKTLINILYCALNICQSRIQLGDLLRLTREGHISFYNFMKHIPEHLRERLSLIDGHSLSFNKTSTIRMNMPAFIGLIPDLKHTLKVPLMPPLVRRYLKDLSLPDDLGDYIERLINFMPPNMRTDYSKSLPNFEARAMAYIVFVLKLIFGIDGYREKEISKSAQRFNKKLKKHNIESGVFVYEEWREFIAYRDVILSKYYNPYVLTRQYEGDKPYKLFLGMLDQTKQEILTKKKKTHTIFEKKHDERSTNTQNLATKLMALHENDDDEEDELKDLPSLFSLTPLYGAMKAIINSNLSSKLNQKIIQRNHRQLSCEIFLKQPETSLFPFHLKYKKCTFPKIFCFGRKDPPSKITVYEINHEDVNEKIWKNEMKQENETRKQLNHEKCMAYHQSRYTEIIEKRLEARSRVRKKLKKRHIMKKEENHELDILDEIFVDYESPNKKDEKDTSDEIADITELESIFNNASFDKFNYEKIQRFATFVIPDFNYWRHFTRMDDDVALSHLDEELSKLPKNFRWLLAATSNVINQSESEIYRHLNIIEDEFFKIGHIELLDLQPEGLGRYW